MSATAKMGRKEWKRSRLQALMMRALHVPASLGPSLGKLRLLRRAARRQKSNRPGKSKDAGE